MSVHAAEAHRGAVVAMLSRSGRRTSAVPLARSFVQQGARRAPAPGPLAGLVRAHDERGLDLFVLHRALASAPPWDVTREARVWARAIGVESGHDDGASGAVIVSRTWARLAAKHQLVAKAKSGRQVQVTALADDGSGQPYTYPTRDYFKVPFAYWLDQEDWHATLTLPAKAMLFVALSLQPPFVLPYTKAKRWYGLSPDTAERGLTELVTRGVLNRTRVKRIDYLSPLGYVWDYQYALKGPFHVVRGVPGAAAALTPTDQP